MMYSYGKQIKYINKKNFWRKAYDIFGVVEWEVQRKYFKLEYLIPITLFCLLLAINVR